MTDGCEEVNFIIFSNEYGILETTSWTFSQKEMNSIEKIHEINHLQPSVMVAKGNISFAFMTHGCSLLINFGPYRKFGLINEFDKKGQFHVSFFKVDSLNQKSDLEYLLGSFYVLVSKPLDVKEYV